MYCISYIIASNSIDDVRTILAWLLGSRGHRGQRRRVICGARANAPQTYPLRSRRQSPAYAPMHGDPPPQATGSPPRTLTNDDIEAIIQLATSSQPSPSPHKDTRTQLFVGNVSLHFLSSRLIPLTATTAPLSRSLAGSQGPLSPRGYSPSR